MQFLPNICFVAIVAVITPTLAQDATQIETPPPATETAAPVHEPEAPPGRAGRLSLVSGNVDLRHSGDAAWAAAELNQPVFAGEALRTDPRARAEIQIGANTIDLLNSTELGLADVTDQVTQITISHGRINLHLRRIGEGESVEIDTPRGGIWLLETGYYDIDAGNGDQQLSVAVFAGSARLVGGDTDTRIQTGETAVLSGSDPVIATIEPAAADAFVEWCRARDYDEMQLSAPYYISPDMTGFAELDSAGSWKISSEYGPIWVPTAVLDDWAPYRQGHWTWIAPWGWTWIDDQPWGFAPFHYGRWARIDERWAWVPGSYVARPLYAPAVVAFLGTPGVGLSFAEGAAVGWFPLAPGEAYWPNYSRDLNYVRNLNRGNVQDVETIRMQADGDPPLEVVNRKFANRQFASVVPRPVFTNGRPVAPALVALPEQRLQNAPVLMGSPQIAPASAQRVAHAAATTVQTGRIIARANHLVIAVPRKSRVISIRNASAQPRGREPVVIRGAHLHAPSYAGTSRARQLIVLHVSHTSRGGAGKGARH